MAHVQDVKTYVYKKRILIKTVLQQYCVFEQYNTTVIHVYLLIIPTAGEMW